MRGQKTLWLLLIANFVFAGGFLAYLWVNAGKPAPVTVSNRASEVKTLTLALSPFDGARVAGPTAIEYTNYLNRLRAAGCPEARVRQIVLSDIEDYFAQKRLELALSFDVEWWHEEPLDGAVEFLRGRGQELEEQRLEVVERLLGAEEAASARARGDYWKSIQLTGRVLGALPWSVHHEVQEICGRSVQEQESLVWSRAYEKQPIPAVTLARLRDQARGELRKILSSEQTEEFLLRFSHNAQELRAELRNFEPTAEEFRKIFRAIDPLEEQLQQQYGDLEALSRQQQERYYRQREEAIRLAVGSERFQAYLASRNNLSLR